MKYRIIEETYYHIGEEGLPWMAYVPQYKYKWWPFWFNFRGAPSAVTMERSLINAQNRIEVDILSREPEKRVLVVLSVVKREIK